MKKLIPLILALTLAACASTPEYDPAATYQVVPKNGDDAQYRSDAINCQNEVSQEHRVKTREQLPRFVDCLVQRGHVLVKKG